MSNEDAVLYETPPWASGGEWLEANRTMDYLIWLHDSSLGEVRRHAEKISNGLQSLFPILDELCAVTCGYCPEPCCMLATVWVDFRDMLFMRLCAGKTPPAQLLEGPGNVCRYLRPKGCILPRIQRPWACTLYLCPAQTSRLRKKSEPVREGFHETVRSIKAHRLEMEAGFIRVTSTRIM